MTHWRDWLRPMNFTTDPDCPDCHGTGHDGSGWKCHCVHKPKPDDA